MKIFNKLKGDYGEDLAAEYLKKIGYTVLKRNYKNEYGEIDVIALGEEYLVFVEVKMRTTDAFGLPSEAVTNTKMRKICQVAGAYIASKQLFDMPVRFDVIEILNGEINHIKNAFESYLSF